MEKLSIYGVVFSTYYKKQLQRTEYDKLEHFHKKSYLELDLTPVKVLYHNNIIGEGNHDNIQPILNMEEKV